MAGKRRMGDDARPKTDKSDNRSRIGASPSARFLRTLMPAPLSRTALVGVLCLTASLWGSSFIVMKAMTGVLPPLMIAALRGIVAAATLCGYFLATGRSLRVTRADLTPAAMMGTLHGWLPNALTAFAVAKLGAGLAAMMQSTTPLMTAVAAHFFLSSERLAATQWAGVAIGFVGVATLIGPEAFSGAPGAALPVLAMLAVAVSYAVGNIWVRGRAGVPPERLALGQQGFGGAAALVLALIFEPLAPWREVPGLWGHILVFGALQSALPFTLFMWMIQRAGPVKAVMVGYLTPMCAAALAVLLLGETIQPRQLLGAAVILAGVFLVTRK
jgi:drug/metabolite transporter (DMT)-like permease